MVDHQDGEPAWAPAVTSWPCRVRGSEALEDNHRDPHWLETTSKSFCENIWRGSVAFVHRTHRYAARRFNRQDQVLPYTYGETGPDPLYSVDFTSTRIQAAKYQSLLPYGRIGF